MRRRLRALGFALKEYDYAMYFEDWAERRNVFAAHDLLDQMQGDGIEDAFYAVGARMKDLNIARRSHEDTDRD